jgi:3-oxoadipate enol-lactonase
VSSAIVLSNSLGTTSALWDAQVPALERHFRVVRYEHRGHRGPDVPQGPYTVEELARDVIALLDRLELEQVSFCGLSLGGMVGMSRALPAPVRVDRLVLCCTSAYLGPAETWTERARLVRAEGPEAVADSVLGRWFTEGFHVEQPQTVAQFRELLVSTPREGYAACCEAVGQWDARENLHALSAPTLVIAGAEDPATPPEYGQLIADGILEARLVVLAGAAHLANVEQPNAFNEALFDHLLLGVTP